MHVRSFVPAAFLLCLSSPALAQGWVEYASRADFFTLNFPGEPAVQETSFTSEYGADFPARVLANVRSEEDSVRAIVAKVQLGEADAGVVYATDVTPAVAPEVHVLAIPEAANVLASYPIAVVQGGRQRAAAQRFVDLVLSEAGQAVLVESRYAIDPWLRFEPSPGHTPGHVCVRLSTSGGEAVFTGDLMHRTVQVAEPQWSSRFCYDGKRAAVTRRQFIERHADSGVLVLAAHFPRPGYVVRADGGHRFVAGPVAA